MRSERQGKAKAREDMKTQEQKLKSVARREGIATVMNVDKPGCYFGPEPVVF